jgi:hypothetical protein
MVAVELSEKRVSQQGKIAVYSLPSQSGELAEGETD